MCDVECTGHVQLCDVCVCAGCTGHVVQWCDGCVMLGAQDMSYSGVMGV